MANTTGTVEERLASLEKSRKYEKIFIIVTMTLILIDTFLIVRKIKFE